MIFFPQLESELPEKNPPTEPKKHAKTWKPHLKVGFGVFTFFQEIFIVNHIVK